MIANRQKAIHEARVRRLAVIAAIRDQLRSQFIPSEWLDELLSYSQAGREKLAQAAREHNVDIYTNWYAQTMKALGQEREEPDSPTNKVLTLMSEYRLPLFDYIGIQLPGAQLGAKMSEDGTWGLDTRMADWTGGNFERANLQGMLAQSTSIMDWCNFSGADLSLPPKAEGRMECGHYNHADFSDANLDGQSVNCVKANGAKFHRAKLTNLYYLCANEFDGAEFHGAVFTGSPQHPDETDMKSFATAIADEHTDLRGAKPGGYPTAMSRSFQTAWARAQQPDAGKRIADIPPEQGLG